jgi:hypothetical protein
MGSKTHIFEVFVERKYRQQNKMACLLFTVLKIFFMPILTILLVLIVVGVILWLVNSYIPMDRKIKSIFNAVVVIIVIIWLLQSFGILNSLKGLHT